MDLIAKSLMGSYAKGPIDPYFEYTTLLLSGNGLNGAQNGRSGPAAAYRDGTFLDGSTNNFTITRNGNTTQGTFSPFSQTGWGNYFDGSSYLSLGVNSAFDLGTGDFSIECWVYPLNTATQKVWIGAHQSGTADGYYIILNPFQLQVYSNGGGGGGVTSNTAPTVNVWNHLLVTRQSGRLRCFLNGVLTDTNATSYTINQDGRDFRIANVVGPSQITAYLSNIRFIKGSVPTAYQTSSTTVGTSIFTPSTTAITLTSQGTVSNDVKVLTCQSNRFRDASSNNFTITTSGSPTVVAFSPFNPTASWSAATNGGSGYFDGTGDYLQIPTNTAFNLGTGAFCVEFWVYITSLAEQPSFINNNSTNIFYETSGSNRGLCLYASAAAQLTSSTTALPLNAWNHVVICRNSTGTLSSFANGNRLATAASNTSTVDFSNAIINRYFPSVAGHLFGYTSDLRMVKGSTPYDPTLTTLTVPTAPLTAITNTSLLLNFTNAGIYDATSKNDLETVGNAQISTAQYKFSPSSMYFDGTADYLLPNGSATNMFTFGTGDFTVEFWMNAISFADPGNIKIIFDCRPLSTDGLYPCIYFYSGQIRYFVNNADRITGSTLSTSQWYHIALSRSGTNTKLFVDGTQVGSTYTDSNNYLCGANRPSIGCRGFNLGDNNYYGYMQDVRITKGYARYTANFTAPTAAFPTL